MKIICFGDSLTGCGGAGGRFSDILRDRFPDHTFLNRGVGGESFVEALCRLQTDVLDEHPDIVLIELGANDWWRNERPVSDWARDLQTCITRIQITHVREAWRALMVLMFFRNAKATEATFDGHLTKLKQAGFDIHGETPQLSNVTRATVTRAGYGAVIEDAGGGRVKLDKAGVLVGNEIAKMISGGYQMFLRTPSGKELPALAPQLTALHAFDEDLREALGITSLYNLSLGTTADEHLYDRVEERDEPRQPRPWEKAAQRH